MHTIESLKIILGEFFKHQPILKAWVFGSFARGENTRDSDIDLLVDYDMNEYPGLLKHVSLIMDLEARLGNKIDLIPSDAIIETFRNSIEKDKILVYERS